MTKLEGPLNEHSDTLYKSDGITEYSSKYWDAWKEGKVETKLAIHETLAEMARLNWENGSLGRASGNGTTNQWIKLFNDVNDLGISRGFADVNKGK